MNCKILRYALAGALLSAATAHGYPYQTAGYITGIKIVNGHQYISMQVGDSAGDRPACHTSESWAFRLDHGSDPILAELVLSAARYGGDWIGPVDLTGSGECSGNVETLKALQFRGPQPG